MIETHPFGCFIPPGCRYLLLGSFVAKPKDRYDWFYANGRNQFWPILWEIYNRSLSNKKEQQELFADLRMAITDIIWSCERKAASNLDTNLTSLTFNTDGLHKIYEENRIEKLFLTSRFVENLFRIHFKDLVDVIQRLSWLLYHHYLPDMRR